MHRQQCAINQRPANEFQQILCLCVCVCARVSKTPFVISPTAFSPTWRVAEKTMSNLWTDCVQPRVSASESAERGTRLQQDIVHEVGIITRWTDFIWAVTRYNHLFLTALFKCNNTQSAFTWTGSTAWFHYLAVFKKHLKSYERFHLAPLMK